VRLDSPSTKQQGEAVWLASPSTEKKGGMGQLVVPSAKQGGRESHLLSVGRQAWFDGPSSEGGGGTRRPVSGEEGG
jgi:hypothetical protein